MHIISCFCQEMDRYSAEGSCICHRCSARKGDFSSADFQGTIKSTVARRTAISRAASGVDLPDCLRGVTADPIVDWGGDGSVHRPGPNSAHYEDGRQRCGAHLVFNAFWLLPHFCVYQMLMRDSLHTIDLGIIVTLIRAILRCFFECVEHHLNIEGQAAAKLEKRFRMVLNRRTGPDGQRYLEIIHFISIMLNMQFMQTQGAP
jgi:hypothetical protein